MVCQFLQRGLGAGHILHVFHILHFHLHGLEVVGWANNVCRLFFLQVL